MLKTSIKDGAGSNLEACVKKTNISEQALCVNISGVSSKIVVPVGTSISGDRIIGNSSILSLDNDGTTFEASVDGSSTPKEFILKPPADRDLIVTEMIIVGLDNGIKLANFLGQNSPLTNGCVLNFKSNNITGAFRTIKTTTDMDKISSLSGFDFRAESAADTAKAIIQMSPALPLRSIGTFGTALADDEFIKFTVNDDLTNILSLEVFVRGIKTDPGAF